MTKLILVLCSVLAMTLPLRADQPTVRVEPPIARATATAMSRPQAAVVRDYLEAWQSVCAALAAE